MEKYYQLRPIKYKKEYEEKIAKKIIKWLYDCFFKGCFEILKDNNTVDNNNNVIIEALKSGSIYYQDNGFYSKTGRFSNKIAKELELIGAKYSKYRKAYIIDYKKLNVEITWAIETLRAETLTKADLIKTFLTTQLGNLTELQKKLLINTAVEEIMLDLQKRVFKTLEEKNIPVIAPKLTDFRANEIAQNYTENLDYWIKNWCETDIVEMRQVVGQMAIDGKSTKTIAEYIENRYGVNKRKALFLARNETSLATTSYLEATYKDEGFTSFKWHTNMDGRERKLHKELNGQIFRFDDPPVIYINEKTGEEQKGLPGQTYNCRCSFSPVFDTDFILSRRKKK